MTAPASAPAPLDWPALVAEALRRRRAEGLTQKEHAALAGVSVPTMIAFDRAQTTLTLATALAILKVVGLTTEARPADAQDAFVAGAEARWAELTAGLPKDDPARMPHGYYAFDYVIDGAGASSIGALLEALAEVRRHQYTGWPRSWVPAPHAGVDGVESWVGRRDPDDLSNSPVYSDFWRAGLDGRLYLRRGYDEDPADVPAPSPVFDLAWPMLRAGQVLLHARRLAAALEAGDAAEIHLRARYAGLKDRRLKSDYEPELLSGQDHHARADTATGAVACPAGAIEERLPELVRTLLDPVYAAFDFFELSAGLVGKVLARLRRQG